MATLNIGYVSAVGHFAKRFSRSEREEALRSVETDAEEGGRCVKDDIAEKFSSACDLALKHVLRVRQSHVKTLRAEVGYGFAEHHKDWLRLGCEIFVDAEEADEAYAFLEEPSTTALIESRFTGALEEFIEAHFPPSLFRDLSSSLYLLEEPENA